MLCRREWIHLPARNSRNHILITHRLDQQDVPEHRQQVVVCRKGRQPRHSQVVRPHDQHRHVYWQDPEHQDQHGMRVIIEVVAVSGLRFLGTGQSADARGHLDDAQDHVCELVRDEGDDHDDQDECEEDALLGRSRDRHLTSPKRNC